jgi:hypothetical protein
MCHLIYLPYSVTIHWIDVELHKEYLKDPSAVVNDIAERILEIRMSL